MRIVTMEEHVTFPGITGLIPKEIREKHSIEHLPMIERVAHQLSDVAGDRLSSMDKEGITMQILSVAGTGADLLSPEEGPSFARQYNDALAREIAPYRERFAAFAHLPMTNPAAAAEELERTVVGYGFKGALINGLTNGKFLDHSRFAPLLARAEQLDTPLYIHPGLPPKTVFDAYYSDLPQHTGQVLAISGWGWHAETAVHILRLILSGTLDHYPRLRLIIGHMGEMLPMMMARCDEKLKPGQTGLNQRSVSQTLRDQVYITTSGVFTLPPLMVALETFGIDNILFSVDYPFSSNEQGRRFLDSLPLTDEQVRQIAHANADRLLRI